MDKPIFLHLTNIKVKTYVKVALSDQSNDFYEEHQGLGLDLTQKLATNWLNQVFIKQKKFVNNLNEYVLNKDFTSQLNQLGWDTKEEKFSFNVCGLSTVLRFLEQMNFITVHEVFNPPAITKKSGLDILGYIVSFK